MVALDFHAGLAHTLHQRDHLRGSWLSGGSSKWASTPERRKQLDAGAQPGHGLHQRTLDAGALPGRPAHLSEYRRHHYETTIFYAIRSYKPDKNES